MYMLIGWLHLKPADLPYLLFLKKQQNLKLSSAANTGSTVFSKSDNSGFCRTKG